MHKYVTRKVKWYLRIRRLFELLLIFVLSPVFLIIMLLTAIWVVLDSPGKVFFVQKRPGRNGKVFNMYKFRSMYSGSDTSFLATSQDKRVTASGKIIRRYRIDELPQLLNIVKGEMSLVGPRPVPLEFLKSYKLHIDNYEMRHLIRPGITGLAQVRQGYTTTVAEEAVKYKYDLFYIKSLSPLTDLMILFWSLKSVSKH